MKQLECHRQRLLSLLKKILQKKIQDPILLQKLVAFFTSGKLHRGSLVLFMLNLLRKKHPVAPSVGVGLEFLHAALLLHDDILDNDHLRRGKPTLHVQYQLLAQQKKIMSSSSFGTNTAICIGDALFFLGMEQLLSVHVPLSLQQFILEKHRKVCLAQMRELSLTQQKTLTEQEILALYKEKTADYTFVVPLLAGAQLSLASKEKQQALLKYGELLGLLFQLKDDELDLFGSVIEIGKPVGSDLHEGKKTLWRFYLESKLSAAERKKLNGFVGKEIKKMDVALVQELLQERGVINLLEKKKANIAIEARKALGKDIFSPLQEQELLLLLDYSLERIR